MPKEGLNLGVFNIELGGLRVGEKPGKIPGKTLPRLRYPPKKKKYEINTPAMEEIARLQGLSNWHEVKSIPVSLVYDKIMTDGDGPGSVYIEKALFRGHRRVCASASYEENAISYIDIKKAAKSGTFDAGREPETIRCGPDCPFWNKVMPSSKKSPCQWRMILTLSTPVIPTFPETVKFRSSSIYTLRSMVTSLEHIARVTGGILAGIPLEFRQMPYEAHDGNGKPWTFLVNYLAFDGSREELMDAAVSEARRRADLRAALGGEAGVGRRVTIGAITEPDGEDSLSADVVSDAQEPDDEEAPISVVADVGVDIDALYAKLDFTPARRKMIEDKHGGDVDAIKAELEALIGASDDFEPSAAEVGNEVDDLFDI